MVRIIDWEERCWQLTHDITVRMSLEISETDQDIAKAVGTAVFLAATACGAFRESFDRYARAMEDRHE